MMTRDILHIAGGTSVQVQVMTSHAEECVNCTVNIKMKATEFVQFSADLNTRQSVSTYNILYT